MTNQQSDEKRDRENANVRPRGVPERPKGNPFGILSLVKTPEEIIQELIDTRGLSPHQVRFALEGKEVELVVGPFVIENPLGLGPSGECSLASQLSSGESVSLRQLPISMNDGEKSLADALQRAREVEHPGLQRALRVGRHDGRIYIAHEFVPGEDLNRYVGRTGRLLPQQAVDCIIRIATALQVAHRKGMIHGELRPSKVVVDCAGKTTVRECATANFVRQRRQESGNLAAILSLIPVRHVQCAAPEAFLPGGKMDFRSDIYSLGCILHFLLTGNHVFAGAEAGRVIVAHRSTRIPSVASKLYGIPSQMDKLLTRLLAKSPGDRFNSYGDLLHALQVVQKSLGKQTADAPRSWWRNVDEDWTSTHQKTTAKLKRYKLSRVVSFAAITLGCGALAAGAAMYWPSKPVPLPEQPAPIVRIDKTESKPRVFGKNDRREVVTVEADEVFRLP